MIKLIILNYNNKYYKLLLFIVYFIIQLYRIALLPFKLSYQWECPFYYHWMELFSNVGTLPFDIFYFIIINNVKDATHESLIVWDLAMIGVTSETSLSLTCRPSGSGWCESERSDLLRRMWRHRRRSSEWRRKESLLGRTWFSKTTNLCLHLQ